jgi:hypothetical protein
VRSMKTSLLNTARESSRIVRNFGWDLRTSIFSVTLLTLSLFSSAALEQRAFSATPASAPRAFATAITGANAQLNGARLIPGATLFLGDVVKLGLDSSAAVQISGKNDQVIITPGTELVIAPEGIRLRTGRIRVRLAGADTFPVTGPFFHVNVAASGGNPGSAEISVSGKAAQVAAVTGVADILMDGSDALHRVDAGKIAMMDDAANGEMGSGKDGSLSAAEPNSSSPAAPQSNSAPSGKSRKTIYIISAAVGGAALGVGLWLSTQETVSPILP